MTQRERQILQLIEADPMISQQELADKLGITRSSVAVHISNLIKKGKEPRVKMFCEAVNAPYIFKGGKPKTEGYFKAMEVLGTTKENTLFVGDQIFTDVWGANRAGIYSFLVKPIHPKEEIQIVLKRYLEKIVLFCYKRYKRKSND